MVYSGNGRSDEKCRVVAPMSDERTHTLATDDDTRHEQYIKTSDKVHVMPANGQGTATSASASTIKHVLNWYQSAGVALKQETIADQAVHNPPIDRGSAILAELQSRLMQDQLVDKLHTQTKNDQEHSDHVVIDKKFRPSGPSDVLEMQRNVLLQPGCVVSTRVILRKCPKFRINGLLEAMQAMSEARHYVGELGQIQSHVRVFYKCPPQLIQPEALEKYNISLQEYMHQFEQNPQPARGGPSDWESYVTKLIEHAPYNTQLFPLEKMGLDGGALKRLRKFREQLIERR